MPPEHLAFSQWFELWKAGGCERRCDGVAQIPSGEVCICDAEDRECKPHTRLSLLLPRLLGSGLWRLDTQGEYAANELGGVFEFAMFLHQATGRTLLPGRLVLTRRSIKRPRQARRDFVVPVLELDADLDALAGRPAAPALGNSAVPAPPSTPAWPPVRSPRFRPGRSRSPRPWAKRSPPPRPRPRLSPAHRRANQGDRTQAACRDQGGTRASHLRRRVPLPRKPRRWPPRHHPLRRRRPRRRGGSRSP